MMRWELLAFYIFKPLVFVEVSAGCPTLSSDSWKVSLLRSSQVSKVTFGCPIAPQQIQQAPLFP